MFTGPVEAVAVTENCRSFVPSELGLMPSSDTVTAGAIVTVAGAVFVGSAWLCAVIVAVVPLVGFTAVNNPPAVIDPALDGDTLQFTAVFVEPVTVAVNCALPPPVIVWLAGVTVIVTAGGAVTVTVAVADLLGSALLSARIVAVPVVPAGQE